MKNNLVKYSANIHVPDTENQGNFEAKGTVRVKYSSDNELTEKVIAYIAEKEECEEDEVTDLIINVIDEI